MKRILILLLVSMISLANYCQSIKITTTQVTQNVTACRFDTVAVKIKNDSTVQLINHKLKLTFTAGATWVGIINVSKGIITVGTTNPRVLSIDTLRPNDSITFKYIINIACASIPNTPPTNSSGVIIAQTDSILINFINASSVNYGGTMAINGVNSNGLYFKTTINYPYLINNTTSTINYTSNGTNATQYYGSTGDVFTRRVLYQNSGTSVFDGRITFNDAINCSSSVIQEFRIYIGKVIIDPVSNIITSPAPIVFTPTLTGSTYSFSVRLDSISKAIFPIGTLLNADSSQIVIEEKVKIVSCLGTGCTSTLNLKWGCSPFDVCKTTIPAARNFWIYRYTTNNFKISRLLPAINYASSSYDFYWDSKCIGDSSTWEYLIQNLPLGQTIYNAKIVLDQVDLGSYTFINKQSIDFNYVNSLTGQLTTIPLDSVSFSYDTLTALDFTNKGLTAPQCLGNYNTPLQLLTITIPKLKAGDKFLLKFKTYKCCPTDAFLFNRGKIFNHWDLWAKGFSDCVSDSFYAVSYRLPSPAVPPLYNTGFWSTNHISSHFYDSGSDLDLKQLFQPPVTDMTGPSGGGCSASAINFEILNLQLVGGLSDQQLFYDSATYGSYGVGQGTKNPHGKFKIDFTLSQGLQILPANYSSLIIYSGINTITWKPVSISQVGNILTAVFDIDSLPSTIKGGTGDAFNNFINSTKIIFPINACCPAPPSSTCSIATYFNPKPRLSCADCWIPMSRQDMTIHVHCPGCITPGIIVDNADLSRENLGLTDANDDGLADNPVNVLTPLSASFSKINRKASIVGDTLKSIVSSHFQDGDNTNPIKNGFTYSQWQTYWNAHGYTNIQYKQLSFEQLMPNSNPTTGADIQILTDTFFILPPGGSWTGYPLNINNANQVKRVGDKYLHKVNVDSMRIIYGSTFPSFTVNDQYRFSSTYSICKNVTSFTTSDNTDYMYFTVNPIANPSFGVLPLSGDYYGQHHTVCPTCSNPDSLPPSVSVIYQCESNGCRHYLYPIKQSLSTFWSDTTATSSCIKNVQAKVTSWIDGPVQDVFPFEYRTVSGFNMYKAKTGLMINPTTGIHFDLQIPTGYTVTPYQTYTDIYRYYSNSQKVQTRCFAQDIPSQWINTAINGINRSYTFKDTFANAIGNGFIYPKGAAINTTTTTFGGPIFYNISKLGNLLGGDERFEQTLVFQYQISCNNGPDSLKLTDSTITVTVNGLGCASGTPVKLKANPNITKLTKPNPIFTLSNQWTNITNNPFSFYKTITVSNNQADNVFFYIDTTQFPSCFVLDSVKIGAAPRLTYIKNGVFNYYKLGNINRGTANTVNYYGHLKCCIPLSPNPFKEYYIQYYLGWNCDSFPSAVAPPLNICNTPILDTMRLRFYDAGFSVLTNQVTKPTGYYTCDTLTYGACVQSSNSGATRNHKFILQMPTNTTLLNNLLVSVGASAAVSVPTGNVTVSGMTTTVNLNFAKMDTLLGLNGLDGTEKICFTFQFVPTCAYTGDPPSFYFTGFKYCGDSLAAFYSFGSVARVGSKCLGINSTILNACDSANGSISLNISKGIAPYTFLWNNGATTQNINSLSLGNYTVTVSSSDGCTVTNQFTILNSNGNNYPIIMPDINNFYSYGAFISDIAVDGQNNIYATGSCINSFITPSGTIQSGNYNPSLTNSATNGTGFVAKFSSCGSLLWIKFDMLHGNIDCGGINNNSSMGDYRKQKYAPNISLELDSITGLAKYVYTVSNYQISSTLCPPNVIANCQGSLESRDANTGQLIDRLRNGSPLLANIMNTTGCVADYVLFENLETFKYPNNSCAIAVVGKIPNTYFNLTISTNNGSFISTNSNFSNTTSTNWDIDKRNDVVLISNASIGQNGSVVWSSGLGGVQGTISASNPDIVQITLMPNLSKTFLLIDNVLYSYDNYNYTNPYNLLTLTNDTYYDMVADNNNIYLVGTGNVVAYAINSPPAAPTLLWIKNFQNSAAANFSPGKTNRRIKLLGTDKLVFGGDYDGTSSLTFNNTTYNNPVLINNNQGAFLSRMQRATGAFKTDGKEEDNSFITPLDTNEKNNDYLLFPNPTNSSFFIQYSTKDNVSNIMVVDALGAIVYNKAIYENKNGLLQIDLNVMAKGIYTVAVTLNNKISYQKLVLLR